MKRHAVIRLLVLSLLPLNALAEDYSGAPVFIENKGQWPAEVLYEASLPGMNAWITKKGVVYDYYERGKGSSVEEPSGVKTSRSYTIKGQVIAVGFEGGTGHPHAEGSKQAPGECNFLGNPDPARRATHVRRFEEVYLRNIYPGIDERWYFEHGSLRYDFIVAPGADSRAIRMHVAGANGTSVTPDGELALGTRFGSVHQGKLYAYQQPSDLQRTPVSCSFVKKANGDLGFALSGVNPGLPLVIDPLVYSTFLGGSGTESIGMHAIAADAAGNTYVCGETSSTNFPLSAGAYSTTNWGNMFFVTKMNPTGTAVVYSTFIGVAVAGAIAVDTAGNAYVTGITSSSVWPTTAGAYRTSLGLASSASFVTKLNASGSALVYSTLIGTNANSYAIALDASGNAYITGEISGFGYPTTAGAFDVSYNGSQDAYITKLNATGTALAYSSYLGGSSTDVGYDVAVDASGNACVAGYTFATNFPTTSGAMATSLSTGPDGFLAKFNISGTALVYSTYVGGNSDDYCTGVAIDGSGRVYVTGSTKSTNFPTTSGAFQTSLSTTVGLNASADAFVLRMNATGSAPDYSTYVGGILNDEARDIAVTAAGSACITGITPHLGGGSYRFYPVTNGAVRRQSENLTDQEVFVTKLNTAGTGLLYSTLLGSDANDDQPSVALDTAGNGYVLGITNAQNFFTTPGAFDTIFATNGGPFSFGELFITKVDFMPCGTTRFGSVGGNTSVCKDDTLRLTASGGYKYSWDGPSGPITGFSDTASIAVRVPYSSNYIATIYAPNGCPEYDTAHVVVHFPPVPVISQNGNTLQTGAYVSYQWFLGGTSIPGATNVVLSPTQNGTYSVVVTDSNGCKGQSNDFVLSNLAVNGMNALTGVYVYPNPTSGMLLIHASVAVQATLSDMQGRVVGSGTTGIDMAPLAKGIYLLTISDLASKAVYHEKVLRQ